MALIIPLGPQVKIGVRIGYSKAPTAKMVVMSLTNGAASVDCNGTNHPITWVATDSDGGAASPAGYSCNVEINGLSEFTSYEYTVTQGENVVTDSFYMLPGENDDFCFYAITCDATASPYGFSNGEGVYKNIKEQVQAGGLPCVGILHIDDMGYVSNRRFADSAAVGLDTQTPAQLNTQYAFSAAWLNFYGLHASGSVETLAPGYETGFGESTASTTTANIDNSRNPNRVWCMRNLPVWPQWGDWEFKNDIGFDFPTNNPDTPNPFHKTYTLGVGNRDGGGLLAWQQLCSHLQPPLINAANSNAWAFDLGCIRVISADGITNANGAIGTNYSNPLGTITTDDYNVIPVASIHGAAQVADILGAVDPNKQFTILGLMNGIRYMDNYVSEWYSGTQHPIKNHCRAEWEALFTEAGSFSDLPCTNNTQGILFTFNGDYHNGHVYHHQITDGTLPTDFYEIGCGTATMSPNHTAESLTTQLGGTYKGSTIDYLDYTVDITDAPTPIHRAWGVRVDVYGSKAFKEIVITLFDSAGTVLWKNKFLGQLGNTKFASDFVVPKLIPAS